MCITFGKQSTLLACSWILFLIFSTYIFYANQTYEALRVCDLWTVQSIIEGFQFDLRLNKQEI